ncbi:AAA family ATPase [Serratia sp. (in: enterobacteria)]|uniref:AAA family ATPase n=1 Tax=Serratia sp. (in: enterobacteria) TaxID=616 RepID=UPI00398A32DA
MNKFTAKLNDVNSPLPNAVKINKKWLRTSSPIEVFITDGNKLNFYQNKNYVSLSNKKNVDIVESKNISINWDKIIGYTEIKAVITSALNTTSKKKTHILIIGSAGTSKTVFLKVLEENLLTQKNDVHYLDSTTLSSSGVIDYMFNNDVRYCLLDEIDKLEKIHQNTFLNLLESGILQETKSKKIRKKSMKDTIVIATGNYKEKLIEPLLTRFLVMDIPKYTKDQFFKISVKLLTEQYNKEKSIAEYITKEIWRVYTEKRNIEPNMRQCVQVATLTGNDKHHIDMIISALDKYSLRVE